MKRILSKKIKVIAVVGPTASGKSAYGIELAKEVNGEIISADSRIVYKGFDIGAAKPTKDEMQGIPHYLIDIVEPTFDYSAGLYKKQATDIINDISSRGKIPIIVGGTGLYTDILLKGFDLPDITPDKELRKNLEKFSAEELYAKLKEIDLKGAESIDSNDKKKIIRALEIIHLTGKTLEQARGKSQSEYEIEWIGKNFERDALYRRINNRVDKMLEMGLIEETKGLLSKYGRAYNIINTIGYKEITAYLDGTLSLDESIELLKKNTRNYAKRQLTWFRKNQEIKWDVYPEKLKK
ncbi:tRNA (adenosine(37)-N6)-dimethylallyltransferase MiaA [bacterium]|nr:tRNA (adenosine(37)-N6)-dimethylallyltransferase MiaA [bacterium]